MDLSETHLIAVLQSNCFMCHVFPPWCTNRSLVSSGVSLPDWELNLCLTSPLLLQSQCWTTAAYWVGTAPWYLSASLTPQWAAAPWTPTCGCLTVIRCSPPRRSTRWFSPRSRSSRRAASTGAPSPGRRRTPCWWPRPPARSSSGTAPTTDTCSPSASRRRRAPKTCASNVMQLLSTCKQTLKTFSLFPTLTASSSWSITTCLKVKGTPAVGILTTFTPVGRKSLWSSSNHSPVSCPPCSTCAGRQLMDIWTFLLQESNFLILLRNSSRSTMPLYRVSSDLRAWQRKWIVSTFPGETESQMLCLRSNDEAESSPSLSKKDLCRRNVTGALGKVGMKGPHFRKRHWLKSNLVEEGQRSTAVIWHERGHKWLKAESSVCRLMTHRFPLLLLTSGLWASHTSAVENDPSVRAWLAFTNRQAVFYFIFFADSAR